MSAKDMTEELMKAQVLVEALPYIQKFNRKIIVVKYGGSAMVDEELKRKVIQDVVLLKLVGFKPIIVHGGGKEISKWVEKSGMTPEFKLQTSQQWRLPRWFLTRLIRVLCQ